MPADFPDEPQDAKHFISALNLAARSTGSTIHRPTLRLLSVSQRFRTLSASGHPMRVAYWHCGFFCSVLPGFFQVLFLDIDKVKQSHKESLLVGTAHLVQFSWTRAA